MFSRRKASEFDFPVKDITLLIAIVGNLDSEHFPDVIARDMIHRCQRHVREGLAHRDGVRVPPLHH